MAADHEEHAVGGSMDERISRPLLREPSEPGSSSPKEAQKVLSNFVLMSVCFSLLNVGTIATAIAFAGADFDGRVGFPPRTHPVESRAEHTRVYEETRWWQPPHA